MRFADYVALATRKCAELQPQHVLAMRLYTTSTYRSINKPFRELVAESSRVRAASVVASRGKQRPSAPLPTACKPPHPYGLTICCLHEAITHLLQSPEASPTPAPQLLYRGYPDLRLPSEFAKGQSCELNAMSTTPDLEVATSFALKSAKAGCLILRIRMDGGARGCDASWLSVFPKEREVLFPPFTVLVPDGEPWEEPVPRDPASADDDDCSPLMKLVVPVVPSRFL